METDAQGHRDDALATLRENGFDIGDTVGAKLAPDRYFTLVSTYKALDVQYVRCVDLDAPIGSTDVPVHVFITNWEKRETKVRVQAHPSWPAHASHRCTSWDETCVKSAIITAVGVISEGIESRWHAETLVEVKQKGGSGRIVVAKAAAEVRTLVLPPDTTSVRYTKPDEAASADGIGVVVTIEKGKRGLEGVFTLVSSNSDSFIAPFWIAKSTDDASKANVEIAQVNISSVGLTTWTNVFPIVPIGDRTEQELAAVDTAAETHPEGQKKAKSTASKYRARRGPEMVGVPFEVMIPIMINIKPLECGEELVVYKPKKQAPGKKPAQPVALKRLLAQAWEQETKEAKEQAKKGRVAL